MRATDTKTFPLQESIVAYYNRNLFQCVAIICDCMGNGYPDSAFINAVAKHEPASTKEVADTVGCSRPTAESHLKVLAAKGDVNQKKIAKVLVWSIPEDN